MNSKSGRRSLEEQIGVAINASSLADRATECAIERIGALGAATLHLRSGASDAGLPISSMAGARPRAVEPSRRGDIEVRRFRTALGAELAATLWHLDYGRQNSELGQAIVLLAEWLRSRKYGEDVEHRLLRPFATRVLHELLSPMCVRCGGSGKMERSRAGQWIRPCGSMQRNATFAVCNACHGSRRQPASTAERRRALGIDGRRYDDERWDRRFEAARRACMHIIPAALRKPLTVQLERSTKRN